jgi:hypothetical protein
MIVKYTFILCAFCILDVHVFIYIVNQISNSLTLTKNYVHSILGRSEYVTTQKKI